MSFHRLDEDYKSKLQRILRENQHILASDQPRAHNSNFKLNNDNSVPQSQDDSDSQTYNNDSSIMSQCLDRIDLYEDVIDIQNTGLSGNNTQNSGLLKV